MKRALFLAAFLCAGGAWAGSRDGTGVASILSEQTSVRGAGMGNAYTAVSDDIGAVYYNPAGLGYLRSMEWTGEHWEGFSSFSQSHLGLAMPIGKARSENFQDFGVAAFHWSQMDYGTIDKMDAAGLPQGEYNATDQLLTFSYGRAFGNRMALGGNVKRYKLRIADRNATGTLGDVGMLVRLVPNRVNLGVSAQNLGGQITYDSAASDAPRALNVGLAFTPVVDRLTLSVEGVDSKTQSLFVRTGAELWVNRSFAVRAGYDSGIDAGPGFTAGFGIAIYQFEVAFFPIDRIMLDYAFMPLDNYNYVNRVALTFRIGNT